MKSKFTGLSVERKRLALLGFLLVALVYFLLSNVLSGDRGEAARLPSRGFHSLARQHAPADVRDARRPRTALRLSRPRGGAETVEEFRPSLRSIRQANIDPGGIDPTLR